MKKSIVGLLSLAIIFTSCAQNNHNTTNAKETTKAVEVVKPEHAKISDKQLQENVAKTMQDDFVIKETQSVKEAMNILNETGDVIKKIAENKPKVAKEKLAKLIGELEILMTRDPEVMLVPVSVAYQVNDAVIDIPAARKITGLAQKAFDDGYYQVAKDLMNNLSSEMIVKTSYLPLATYPDAMKLSAALLEDKKNEEAAAVLIQALNTMVVQQDIIPLPVLRAEEFIKLGAAAMAEDKADKKAVAQLYLDNADYQLQLAEALGYGKKDEEYKELYDAIKDLKKAITDDKESKGKFEKLSEKIKAFKERLFFKKDSVK